MTDVASPPALAYSLEEAALAAGGVSRSTLETCDPPWGASGEKDR